MSFKTYYITLNRTPDNEINLLDELNRTDLTYERWEGVDCNNINQNLIDMHITTIGNIICPPKTKAIALSHITLNKHLYENTDLSYALVLEDDVILNENRSDYSDMIEKLIVEIETNMPNWDLIQLHSMGFYKYKGSTASYIVSRRGMKKISEMKICYHIDCMLNNGFNRHIFNNKFFTTRDKLVKYNNPINNIVLCNQPIGFYLEQPVCNFIDGKPLQLYEFLSLIILLYTICVIFIGNVGAVILTSVVFFIQNFVSHVFNYSNKKFKDITSDDYFILKLMLGYIDLLIFSFCLMMSGFRKRFNKIKNNVRDKTDLYNFRSSRRNKDIKEHLD